jgi:DNA (cytosine-5)-methyltransferase 1
VNGRPTYGSLFSGIGGFDLALDRAGWQPLWQVEIEPDRRAVLENHWPAVRRFGDIRAVEASDLHAVTMVAGGFPCADVSDAGGRAGIEGVQSGLWAEFARIVRHLRPRYVLVENTTGLLARGFGRVVGDLAAIGYDAEWDCLPAAAIGAPHLRAREFLLAYPSSDRGQAVDTIFAGRLQPLLRPRWAPEPAVARMADGLPGRLDRRYLGPLGDAVVPQVAEVIARLIRSHYDRADPCASCGGDLAVLGVAADVDAGRFCGDCARCA